VRESMKITAIGSCRISTPFKVAPQYFPVVNNATRIYGYTHTSTEALQQIRFLQGADTPHSTLRPLLMPNVDIEALADISYDPSDIYFVELSSAKALAIGGVQVQLNYVTQHFADFFADKARAAGFWCLSDGQNDIKKLAFLNSQDSFHQLSGTDQILLNELTRTLATPKNLIRDMAEIQRLLPHVVFITHANANGADGQPIGSRAKYIAMVEDAARTCDATVFNPTASMLAFGQSAALSDPETSLSHYAPDFADFLFAGLYERYIAPHKTRGMLDASQALAKAIALFEGRAQIKSISPHMGNLTFITGSLGAGGAERQLTRLAVGLHNNPRPNGMRGGISGDIEVIVSTLDPARERDFFLPDLQDAGIPVSVISQLPANLAPGDLIAQLQGLIRFLPPQTQEAIQRLTPHFITRRPEVAYIWQDGAVLATALAALAANVPRIIISLRGMPPNLRPEMMKNEYFDLYRALSKIPGVTFSANTHASADAYANWLDMPAKSIRVVHNAAEVLPMQGDDDDQQKWEDFRAATPDADFTYGAVFRFDQNKRPLLWLEFAAAALAAHPASRFVLVGDGAEMAAAQDCARDMSIDRQCLFVGKSRNVGFWMARMNALGLTSRLEGLPNVLIEAQLAGLPVISTPAGGAAETFIPNQSGFLLNNAETPDLPEFLEHYLALATDPAHRKTMGKTARRFARDTFAMDKILSQTLHLLSDSPKPRNITSEAVFA